MSRVHTPYMYHVLTVIQWFIWLGGCRSITISCFAVKTRVFVFGSIVSWISLQQSNLREKSKFTGRNCGVSCVHFWTAGDRDILGCPSGGFPAPYKSYKGQCLQGYHKSPAIFEGLDSVRAVTVAHRRLLDFPERSFASLEMWGIVPGICKLRSSRLHISGHVGSTWCHTHP